MRTPLRVAAVVAIAGSVVAGIAGIAFGLTTRPASLSPGANEFVYGRSSATAHNSPTVAVDPRQPSTVVVANRVDAPELGCAVSVSSNAGATWRPLDLTPTLAAPNCYWPRAAYLDDGTLLVLSTDLVGVSLLPGAVWLQRYEGLRPVGPPVRVAGELAFWGRVAVAGQRVWVSYVQAGPATWENQLGLAPGSNPVVVVRSDDGGRTFGSPVRVSEPDRRVIQPTVLAGPNDRVTIGALDLADDVLNYEASHDGQTPPDPGLRWRIVSWTSTDGGATFGPTSTVADGVVVPQLILADLGPTPGFAVDTRSGRLYATWDGGRDDGRDCFVAFSDDGGRRWSDPVRVGPAPGSQLLPAVAVAPDGRVDVVLYDRSRDPQDIVQEAVVASSSDGGRTFRWTTVSDVGSDSRIGLGAQQGVPLQGDHLALLSRTDDVLAFWADTSRGTLSTNVQDLAVVTVDVSGGGGRRWAWVAVGAAVLLAGLALALLSRAPGDTGPPSGGSQR